VRTCQQLRRRRILVAPLVAPANRKTDESERRKPLRQDATSRPSQLPRRSTRTSPPRWRSLPRCRSRTPTRPKRCDDCWRRTARPADSPERLPMTWGDRQNFPTILPNRVSHAGRLQGLKLVFERTDGVAEENAVAMRNRGDHAQPLPALGAMPGVSQGTSARVARFAGSAGRQTRVWRVFLGHSA
jgi:hypothetical protein